METTRYIQTGGRRHLFILFCLYLLSISPKTSGQQCELSAIPSSITFTEIGENNYVTISNPNNCPFLRRSPTFISTSISGNRLTVTLSQNPGSITSDKIELVHQVSGAILLTIPVTISLNPPETPLSGGSIRCNTTTVAPGTSPGTISNFVSPAGGTGSYSYQWLQSPTGSIWGIIDGATEASYICPPLTATTHFRRSVTSGLQTAYSNTIKITVGTPPADPLSGGSISCNNTTVVSGTSPGTINNSSSPSGGTGGYTYQWQQSTNGGSSWTSISGATGITYSCPVLTVTTSFRRGVTSGSVTKYSNMLTITVLSEPYPITPSSSQNYILIQTRLDPAGIYSSSRIDYYDGLGRSVETVLHRATPSGKDIVTLQEYDRMGRPTNSYIPAPANTATGAYVDASKVKDSLNSFYNDTRAYAKTIYEPNSLNLVKEHYGPGSAWHTGSKRVVTDRYAGSSGDLSCSFYTVASTTSLQRQGSYVRGELAVTKTTDEDGHIAYTFTDKIGRVVLERVMNGTVKNDTYYIYDDFSNLRYVLPPAASDELTTDATWTDTDAILKNFAYVYKYDDLNRCTQKCLPGCNPVEMRYDKADRMIFSQDGRQRDELGNQWTFYFYDDLGRPTVTGIWKSGTVPATKDVVVKTSYSGSGSLGGYTVNLSLPAVDLMTVNYYDDYSFRSIQTILTDVNKLNCTVLQDYDNAFPSASAPAGKGLLTGTRTYRLDDPSKYTVSALYYDYRGRVVQSHTSNQFGGFEDEYMAYTFSGKVARRCHVHTKGTATETEVYTYDYGDPRTNPSERLQSVRHRYNGGDEVILARYNYDGIGRIHKKKIHGDIDSTTYYYNVRSWLTQLEGPRFNQTLTYNAPVNGLTPAKALYNGNISAMKWKSGDETTVRGYKFNYDNLDRLTAATYGEGSALTNNPDRFNEIVTYNDKMGNIGTLQRRGKLDSSYGPLDNLTYTYTGNQITKVTDAVTPLVNDPAAFHFVDRADQTVEYEYDKNGNLKKDLNKNISLITYNPLNLPSVITFSGNKSITYGYDAAGSKLSVAYLSDGVTSKIEYAGNKVYNNGTLGMLLTEEGYITPGTTPTYHYYLKDHQGNNRVVVNQTGTVQQVNHYYPFGGLFGEGLQNSNQRYKYNGKEIDRSFALDMYDYGARHYDAALGKWFTVDPLAEKYYSISPYVYVVNNPVRFIDPNGKWIVGTDGKRVTFKNGEWSSNASEDVKRIGNALTGTTTGTERLNYMLDHSDKISMTLSSEIIEVDGGIKVGSANPIDAKQKSDGTIVVGEHKITIYEKAIEKVIGPEAGDNPYKGLTMDEAIGAVAGHESGHTEPENVKQGVENKYGELNVKHDTEARPNEIENKILEEIRNKKKE